MGESSALLPDTALAAGVGLAPLSSDHRPDGSVYELPMPADLAYLDHHGAGYLTPLLSVAGVCSGRPGVAGAANTSSGST
ncbi:hypothetical protein HGA13_19575 [Nocardia speluncae]|uniref:Uncharacterized protein n=1 Tax=Nocardia speluncae TaxID=419477 RepID=A0A846XL01_9NOCA|nr:hypothetical protein [Nocardia speluncae]NKY35253.1 hypothetical protein [Nocardia speluncae]